MPPRQIILLRATATFRSYLSSRLNLSQTTGFTTDMAINIAQTPRRRRIGYVYVRDQIRFRTWFDFHPLYLILDFTANLPVELIGMESCGREHFLGWGAARAGA